ncbi:phage resistance protein [Micromonospora sp. WMMC415]|uniref:BREX-2 system ATPase PglY n=1 Tax=Micromonospora sp. WMMC415 TaxID=2675222 RepID=UPI0012B4A557|nr:phage resistance protein [Micromonospora sp. WMMC415]QGN48446.1 phage resistance protein [Micromonospora sp. WMMC415]
MSSPSPAPLLREFIDIPERTSTSDFVLKLADSVADADATLRDYVVTDRLLGNFDEALGLIRSAVEGHASKAAYLHGSFGSGKSHFMAVLHALLRGEAAARGRDEFAPLVAKHSVWLDGRRFLLVPYHLLDARSLEQRVLGGYVDRVRALHPEAPIPAVHRTDSLLEQAALLRAKIGDERFIAGLPGGDVEDEWGETEAFWTSERLDAAFAGAYSDELRRKLVNDLLTSWNVGFFSNAREDAEAFISLDRGLTEISRHAKELGYHGLILFLDELILWLANSIGDQQFVSREIQKITNFVEGGDTRRPIPVISFIARQRDLRELVGEEVTGANELSYQDTLNLASGRFDVIKLEDRNLPEIARRRLLKPRDTTAAAAIGRAFDATTKVRREVFDTLLGTDSGSGADVDAFRSTYPFSPAFISTLVHVSSALQRSRTALKLMRQLLVDRRDTLRLGQLVPLGDLYDVISSGGDQPFTEKLKAEFEMAQKLYDLKLRPHLLGQYGLTDEDLDAARRGEALPAETAGRIRAFTGDDRLIKTLLLAALAPSVPALRNLTARRLSALNHGSITSPIPGGEVAQVSRKLADWAGQFAEIRIGEGDDPVVSLELVGVDVDSVLATAKHYDNEGARKHMVQRLLWQQLGVQWSDSFFAEAGLTWRGSRRVIELVYGNVRDPNDIRDDAFHPNDPDGWRLIIDYPFDDGSHGPADDRQRVQDLVGRMPARTVCWIPAALTVERLTELGKLVIIDKLLEGQRFDSHAEHLNPDDRRRAHAALTNQRSALLAKMNGILRQAYGLAGKQASDVVLGFDDHLQSLTRALEPKLPMGAAFNDALRTLADQMLSQQFPAHPDFDPDRKGDPVRLADLKVVLDHVRRAVESPEGRVEVERVHRQTVRRIANPLGLGTMHEANFVIGGEWVQHFQHKAATEGITGELRVADLVGWMDAPKARGLDPIVAQLVVATFAEQTDRAFYLHGSPIVPAPDLGKITLDHTLREERLPSETDWDLARARAAAIFGFQPLALRRGRLVALFGRELMTQAGRHRHGAADLVARLEQHADWLRLSQESGRLATARAAADLLRRLADAPSPKDAVERLAGADLTGPADRTGKSISSAAQVSAALAAAPWDTFEIVAGLPEPYAAEAAAILADLRRIAQADELTAPLAPALRRAQADATTLLRRATRKPEDDSRIVYPPRADVDAGEDGDALRERAGRDELPAPSGRITVGRGGLERAVEELRAFASDHPDATIEVTWRIVP